MAQRQDFFRRSEKMFSLYGVGNFKEALAVANTLATEFPEETASTDFWRICLLNVSGETRNALDTMQKSIDAGMWWSEPQLRADTDLASLQGNAEFERMVTICKERQSAAQAGAKPGLLVREPGGAGPHPLLIALHGRSSSPEHDLARWELVVPDGWLLAMPQSSQLGSPNSYVWDDAEKGMLEIDEHYKSLVKQYQIDTARIVLGGFSQGAALSILLTLDGRIPARGFLPISPGGLSQEILETLAKSAYVRGTRGYMVVGGHDFRFEMLKGIYNTLCVCQIPCIFEEHAEMAHEFPSDFDQTLQRAMDFIFEKKE